MTMTFDVLESLPLVAQMLFTYANWPRIKTLLQKRRSDQHSIQNILVTVLGHLILAPFYWVEVDTLAAKLASTTAIVLAGVYLGLVLWFRKWPGAAPQAE